MSTQPLNLNSTTPAAPTGSVNAPFAADAPNADLAVVRNVSVSVPVATATAAGLLPTPPNDATKILNGKAAWVSPTAPATMTNLLGGLVPTPPNNAAEYLDGTGVFSIPAAGGGGGGGGIYPAMNPPLSSIFSWENQGTAAAADKTSRMVVSVPDSYAGSPAVTGRSLVETLPYAAPYTIEFAVSLQGATGAANALGVNLALFDGSGNVVSFGIFFLGNASGPDIYYFQRTVWSGSGAVLVSTSGTAAQLPMNPALLWIRLVDDGTNRNFYISNNGQDWVLLATEGNTTTLTPTQIGLLFYNNSGGSALGVTAQFSVFHYAAANSALPAIGA